MYKDTGAGTILEVFELFVFILIINISRLLFSSQHREIFFSPGGPNTSVFYHIHTVLIRPGGTRYTFFSFDSSTQLPLNTSAQHEDISSSHRLPYRLRLRTRCRDQDHWCQWC